MYVSFIARNTASRRVCKIGIIVGYVDRIVIVRNVCCYSLRASGINLVKQADIVSLVGEDNRIINRLPLLLRLDRSKLETKAANQPVGLLVMYGGQAIFHCSVGPCDEQKRQRRR